MPPSRSPSRETGAPDTPRPAAPGPDTTDPGPVERGDPEHARAVAVLGRLQDAVTALVLAAEASLGERCPYRDAADACTFAGGCQNQRRDPAHGSDIRCGGDGRLRWTP